MHLLHRSQAQRCPASQLQGGPAAANRYLNLTFSCSHCQASLLSWCTAWLRGSRMHVLSRPQHELPTAVLCTHRGMQAIRGPHGATATTQISVQDARSKTDGCQ